MHEQNMDRTTAIAAAFVGNNSLRPDEVPSLIKQIYGTLTEVDAPKPAIELMPEPSVPIRASVKHDRVTCLECGWSGQMLKRHIMVSHGLTEEAYRKRWALPVSHALTAPDYADRRRFIALQTGLGRKRKGR